MSVVLFQNINCDKLWKIGKVVAAIIMVLWKKEKSTIMRGQR